MDIKEIALILIIPIILLIAIKAIKNFSSARNMGIINIKQYNFLIIITLLIPVIGYLLSVYLKKNKLTS